MTRINKEKSLLTLFARQISQAKVITKINRGIFKNVIRRLDLRSVIYLCYIISETRIAYVIAKKNSMNSNIETLYHMFDSRVKAIEFRVNENFAMTDVPLKELQLKKNLFISFINYNGKKLIPSRQDSILLGDTVMIVTTNISLDDIRDILL